jgi:hypothetical protein
MEKTGSQVRDDIFDLGDMLTTLRKTVGRERRIMIEEARNEVVALGLIIGFLLELCFVGITLCFVARQQALQNGRERYGMFK